MTGRSRGHPDPQHEAQNALDPEEYSSPVERTSRRGGRRPSKPLERRLSNVVQITDASRLVEGSQLGRHVRFQFLVRHYMSQIFYGCKSSFCTTPSCLSCNQRLNTKPFRCPTQLTARALAHFLSSQDDPYRGLCPHELKVSPGSLEIEGADGIDFQEAVRSVGYSRGGSQIFTLLSETHKDVGGNGSIPNEGGLGKMYSVQGQNGAQALALLNGRHQKKKDVKALGQNLYDTATVIYSFSKHVPRPSSIFAIPTAPRELRHKEQPVAQDQRSIEPGPYTKALTMLSQTIPELTAMQHSRQEQLESHNRYAKQSQLDAQRNDHRLSKARHHWTGNANGKCSSFKSVDPVPSNGTVGTRKSAEVNVPNKTTNKRIVENQSKPFHPPGVKPPAPVKENVPENLPALFVASRLNCKTMDKMKDELLHQHHDHLHDQSPNSYFSADYDASSNLMSATSFVNRSIFFTLSDPETLLQSFRETNNQAYKHSPLPHLNSTHLTHAFRDWNRRNGSLVFDSLWIAVKALFTPPPELDVHKCSRLKASRRTSSADRTSRVSSYQDSTQTTPARYLSDKDAAHIIMICIHALTSLIPVGWAHTWVQLRDLRSWGITIPDAPAKEDFTDGFADPWLEIVDGLEYEPALRLADRLVRGIGARLCFEHIISTLRAPEAPPNQSNCYQPGNNLIHILIRHLEEVERLALANKKKLMTNQNYLKDPGWTVTSTFMEWLRTIIIKKWDGKAMVNKWNNVGVAVQLFDMFHENSDRLNLRPQMFHMHYIHERLDVFREPAEYLKCEENPNYIHLMQFPCLFKSDYLISYFRTINFTSIFKSYERTEQTAELRRRLHPFLTNSYAIRMRDRMDIAFSDYFVLQVSRKDALKETLDHLWGNEKRLLKKPLKVRLGDDFGEIGIDQGGVTYEFFQIVLSQAFQPDTGMFTVDPQTRMIWFQPASLEPLWRFEMLGLLFSIAVYNGITLPITFPYALYYNLLWRKNPKLVFGYPDKTEFIRDGWPELARSFDELLIWSDGDVGEVFMRDYTFSFDAFGRQLDVDIQAFGSSHDGTGQMWPADYEGVAGNGPHGAFAPTWPTNVPFPDLSSPAWERIRPQRGNHSANGNSTANKDGGPPSDDPPPVTTQNRDQYVKDYILWLTYRSVAPQLEAFRKGFHTLLEPKSLHFFTPSTLRSLVEGSQIVDVAAWKKATRYEQGYSAAHPTIEAFWSVVQGYNMDERRKLLEFATASERVPVTGFESVNFVIEKQGPDSELLPSASTCFDKLYLPEYETKEKLKAKLDVVIHYPEPWGFGIA